MPPPEKQLFTLDEIAERWRSTGFDRPTFLQYARQDLLVFSVYLRDLGHHRTIRDVPDGRVTTTHSVAFRFQAKDYQAAQVRHLKADDARRILEARPGEQVGVHVLYSERLRKPASGTGYPAGQYFTPDDLLITLAERDLFEFTHSLRVTPGQLTRAWRWLGEQSNQRALQIVGGVFAAAALGAWAVFTWWFQNAATGR